MNRVGNPAGARSRSRHLVLTALGCVLALVFPLALVSGCSSSKEPAKDEPTWVQTVIYFGLEMPGGGVVTEEQFGQFLSEVVTEEFPMGLTAYYAYGQMARDDGSIVKQQTKVVLLAHEKNSANDTAVKRIIDEYRSRFSAPQAMKTTIPIDVEFFQQGTAPAGQ